VPSQNQAPIICAGNLFTRILGKVKALMFPYWNPASEIILWFWSFMRNDVISSCPCYIMKVKIQNHSCLLYYASPTVSFWYGM